MYYSNAAFKVIVSKQVLIAAYNVVRDLGYTGELAKAMLPTDSEQALMKSDISEAYSFLNTGV